MRRAREDMKKIKYNREIKKDKETDREGWQVKNK